MVLFPNAAGAGGPGDHEYPKDPKDPKDPKKPKDPAGPGGCSDLPPKDPHKAREPSAPKKDPKMGTPTHPSMRDVPLFKEGDDPIAFMTLFTSDLNYHDIDPTTEIDNPADPGADRDAIAKAIKKYYTDPKMLLGCALQGHAASWFLDDVQKDKDHK